MDDKDLLAGLPGFRDFYPEVWSEISYLLEKMREVATSYGYLEYEGPSIESVALIEAKSGEGLMREIFQLRDRNNRRLLLRPEQTPTLARMLAKEQQRYKRPIRWFSIPRLFRDETVQKGREREFWQLNVDILGEDSVVADAETIAVAIDIVRACGLRDDQFKVFINHRELLNNYIESITDISPDKVIPLVDKKMSFIQEKVQSYLVSSGMDETSAKDNALLYRRIINAEGKFRQTLMDNAAEEVLSLITRQKELEEEIYMEKFAEAGLDTSASKSLYKLISISGSPDEFLEKIKSVKLPESCLNSIQELEKLAQYLDSFGVIEPVVYDASMARGLDYYTGIVYESFESTGEVVRAIFGGGRYSDLVEAIGGTSLSGVGFGMGDAVLLELMKLHKTFPKSLSQGPDLYLAPIKEEPIPTLIKLATRLRESFTLICNPFKWRLKRHFESADYSNAKLVLLLGMKDIEQNQVTIRRVDTGENFQLAFDDSLEAEISKILKQMD